MLTSCPFADGGFDGVITTAVLEHVLYPETVAAEIFRVLKPDGYIYSEMPFLQRVHEGAYDFTRYTLSGHRRLMNGFGEIDSGPVAGPGTALVWAIEGFAVALSRNERLKLVLAALVRCLFFWLSRLDRWIAHRPAALDSASCTYFLGQKKSEKIPDKEIIDSHRGGQKIRHVD